MTSDEIRQLLLERAAAHSRKIGSTGVRAWCVDNGVINSHVSEFMTGLKGPPSDMLAALGLEWQVVPRRKRGSRE